MVTVSQSVGVMQQPAVLVLAVVLSVVSTVLAAPPTSPGLPAPAELQKLEDVLEGAALLTTQESSTGKRVARHQPAETEASVQSLSPEEADSRTTERRARQDLPWSSVGEDGRQKGWSSTVVGSAQPVQGKAVIAAKSADQGQKGSDGRHHFNSGYGGVGVASPQVTYNVPAAHVSYSVGAPAFPASRPAILATGGSSCGGPGCGGQTIHIHDAHIATQHVPQTYTATVPFIAGYRLTPVVGQKQITLNDFYSGAASGLGLGVGGVGLGGVGLGVGGVGLGAGASCDYSAWGGPAGYWQHLYGKGAGDIPVSKEVVESLGLKEAGGLPILSPVLPRDESPQLPSFTLLRPDGEFPVWAATGRNALWEPVPKAVIQTKGAIDTGMGVKPEEILRPFEQARFFQPPLDLDHGLSERKEYETRLTDLSHQMEHLESLRNNVSDDENMVA